MSDQAVRSWARDTWPLATPTLPYFETINVALDVDAPHLPAVWGTVTFVATSKANITMGSNPWIEEQGVISICVLSRSGSSDTAAATMATRVSKEWSGLISPDGSIWTHSAGPPQSPEDAAVGNWMLLVVPIEYRYQHRQEA